MERRVSPNPILSDATDSQLEEELNRRRKEAEEKARQLRIAKGKSVVETLNQCPNWDMLFTHNSLNCKADDPWQTGCDTKFNGRNVCDVCALKILLLQNENGISSISDVDLEKLSFFKFNLEA